MTNSALFCLKSNVQKRTINLRDIPVLIFAVFCIILIHCTYNFQMFIVQLWGTIMNICVS